MSLKQIGEELSKMDFRLPKSGIEINDGNLKKIEPRQFFTDSEEYKNYIKKMANRSWIDRHPKTSFICGIVFGVILTSLMQKYILPLLNL